MSETDIVEIDGSSGEGGGQILRTSLGLSLVTGRPFRIVRVRAGRDKPGLLRQHLTAVEAAVEVGSGTAVDGAHLGSQEVSFRPGPARAGLYELAVGTAGSATLVLQTILPALHLAEGGSTVILEGGTHNPWAPPFDFLERSFVPLLARMGARVSLSLSRAGFYPGGGGAFTARIEGPARLVPLELLDGGRAVSRRAVACVSNLPRHIAERELQTVRDRLGFDASECAVVELANARGPGNVVTIALEREHVTEVVTGFGEKGVTAEEVAARACREAKAYLAGGAPVGEHLADQLLVPMAIGAGGAFRTASLSRHATTNIEVLGRFLGPGLVRVEPAGAGVEVRVAAHEVRVAAPEVRVAARR